VVNTDNGNNDKNKNPVMGSSPILIPVIVVPVVIGALCAVGVLVLLMRMLRKLTPLQMDPTPPNHV